MKMSSIADHQTIPEAAPFGAGRQRQFQLPLDMPSKREKRETTRKVEQSVGLNFETQSYFQP
jgi:hypothetical protein